MKQAFLFLLLTVQLSAQTNCGNDISSPPRIDNGIQLGSVLCKFTAPGLDTLLTPIQALKNPIEWIHQLGYAEVGIGDRKTGQIEISWMAPTSHSQKVDAWLDPSEIRHPGEIELNGQIFYQYIPEGIVPDKSGTYSVGYGDAAPALCGCLRRVTVKTETLYAGKPKSVLVSGSNVDIQYGINGNVTLTAKHQSIGIDSSASFFQENIIPNDPDFLLVPSPHNDPGFGQPIIRPSEIWPNTTPTIQNTTPTIPSKLKPDTELNYVIVGRDLIDSRDYLGIDYYGDNVRAYYVRLRYVAGGITCEVMEVSGRPVSTRKQDENEFFQASFGGNGHWIIKALTSKYGHDIIIPVSYLDRLVNFVHEYFSSK